MIKQRIIDLLATGRVANLPTVASHVLVASAASYHFLEPLDIYTYTAFGILLLLACLLYVGGCFLGDGTDAAYDAEHRPERPIPSGALSAQSVSMTGYILLGGSCIIACLFSLFFFAWMFDYPLVRLTKEVITNPDAREVFSPWLLSTCLLFFSVFGYAKTHKKMGVCAVVLMALCRSLLVLWVAYFWQMPFVEDSTVIKLFQSAGPYAIGTFLYTLLLSLVARNESNPNAKTPSWALQLLFIVPVLIPFVVHVGDDWTPITFISIAVYLSWMFISLLKLKKSIPGFVSAALAGFCLMDACFAAFVDWKIALVCFGLFLVALLLQRVAPAT